MTTATSEKETSPTSEYCITLDKVPDEPTERSGSSTPSQFFCRFDPTTRKGSPLMVLFDCFGSSTLKEMSRQDVLRVIQDAAVLPKGASPTQPNSPVCDVQPVHTRDIRRMENTFSASNKPSIVIKRQAIFFNADPLRAIVLRDACLVYVPDGADSLLSMLKHYFLINACDNASSPYELRAMEALLATLARFFRGQYDQIAPVIVAELEDLVRGNLTSRKLERLREFKNTMNEFESQVDGVRRVLMELLDNEEDLRLLYLTKIYQDPSLLSDLWSFDSEEAEVLIENYLQDIFSTRTTAELLQYRITNTESLVTLKLDSKRNYLLKVQLIFTLVSINISVGTLISGVFGMNLASGLESAAHWFWGVVIATAIFFIVSTGSGIVFFKRKGVMLNRPKATGAARPRCQHRHNSIDQSLMSEPLEIADGMRGESEADSAPSPLLAGVQPLSDYLNPATAYGTYSSYQRVGEVRTAESAELSGSSSFNSMKKFACQFEPGIKSGRVLVMLFDCKGRPTLKEMSRHEVLRMAQEAAEPKEEALPEVSSSPETGTLPTSPMRRRSSSTAGKIWRLSQQPRSASQQELHAPVCGVQRVHARDIRKMENAFSVTNEPRIVIRKQAILISADPLRAIVLRDVCLVYVPDGADALLSLLKAKFAETARDEDAPFEFRALEALLSTLSRFFQSQYDQLSPVVVAALDNLMQGSLQARELEKLREFKNTINEFETQVDGVRRVLMVMLDNEEDLRLLYLTRLYNEPDLLSDLWRIDSEEIEVLIENYLQDIFSTRTKAELMQHRISNTESLVMMQLDSMRNYLLGVDVIFSIVVISLSVGTFVAGVFGMNLHSGLENADGWFLGVVLLTVSLFLVLTITGVLYFKSKGVLLQ